MVGRGHAASTRVPIVSTVVITGAAGGLGRRVLPRLLDDPTVDKVVVLDRAPMRTNGDRVEAHQVDLARSDLGPLLAGADTVVHLAFALGEGRRAEQIARANLEGTRRLLAAAAEQGIRHMVALSSATVYGAWPNNPVPLTEDSPLRPNPDVAYAVQKSYVEHLVADWADAAPGRTAAVLRPVTALAEEGETWVAWALAEAASLRAGEDDPPAQFVHLDDLAAAVDLARAEHLDGPYNVAPDGWIAGDTVRALKGAGPRIRLPDKVAVRLEHLRWRWRRGRASVGLLRFATYPVVVANDRLRAAGWAPRRTNEQAYVAGTEARWWTTLSPKRRQELSLGLLGLVIVKVGTITTLLVVRAVRRARARRAAADSA
jgi:nucleoside-diphosphate-sugar epimerase